MSAIIELCSELSRAIDESFKDLFDELLKSVKLEVKHANKICYKLYNLYYFLLSVFFKVPYHLLLYEKKKKKKKIF